MSEADKTYGRAFLFSKPQSRPDVEFFDPPMCCSSGVCGPTVDQTLLDVNETIAALKKEGYQVERYQMTSHPQVFLNHSEVMRLVREKEMAALPIVVVRGEVMSEGKYPNLFEILGKLTGGK